MDYKERLSGPDFVLFVQLRELRKKLATDEVIPVYAICTNEQLAAMAEGRTAMRLATLRNLAATA